MGKVEFDLSYKFGYDDRVGHPDNRFISSTWMTYKYNSLQNLAMLLLKVFD